MKRISALAIFALAFTASAARAQDFGREWMDRVTRQLEQERAPLDPRPAELRFFAGERVYFDNNVYLTRHDRQGDNVFVTYGNARLDYAEEDFDAAMDLQANYNYYLEEDDARDDEERLFGRARYAGAGVQVEVAQILRWESDPFIDPQIAKRVERFVSDTFPRVTVGVTDVFSLEAVAGVQFVRFAREEFSSGDNLNFRAGLLAAWELPSGVQLLLDGGYLSIDYRNDPTDAEFPGPPDTRGGYVRGGFRGDVQPWIYVSVLAGATRGESEEVEELGIESRSLATADVEAHLRVEGTERAVLFADYVRRLGFGAGESFEVINRAMVGIEYAVDEKTKLNGRLQGDTIHGGGGMRRVYLSASGGFTYLLYEELILDAGVTYRRGKQDGGGEAEFTDVIGSVGLAVSF